MSSIWTIISTIFCTSITCAGVMVWIMTKSWTLYLKYSGGTVFEQHAIHTYLQLTEFLSCYKKSYTTHVILQDIDIYWIFFQSISWMISIFLYRNDIQMISKKMDIFQIFLKSISSIFDIFFWISCQNIDIISDILWIFRGYHIDIVSDIKSI